MSPTIVSMLPSRVSPILQDTIWAPVKSCGCDAWKREGLRAPVVADRAGHIRVACGGTSAGWRGMRAVQLWRHLAAQTHRQQVSHSKNHTDQPASHSTQPLHFAPGAMPFSEGSSGWCAAVMPATCVPWLPASTTAGREGVCPCLEG